MRLKRIDTYSFSDIVFERHLLIVMFILFLLSGFIDTTPTYTVEELDERYGTSIADLGFNYKKEHHYSLLKHDKVEYVFRGTKQYSYYFVITVRAADQMDYLSENTNMSVVKTLSLNIKGHDTEIRIYNEPKADATVQLENGCIRVGIVTNDNADIKDYWVNNPISDSSFIAIFEDIISIILKEWR